MVQYKDLDGWHMFEDRVDMDIKQEFGTDVSKCIIFSQKMRSVCDIDSFYAFNAQEPSHVDLHKDKKRP